MEVALAGKIVSRAKRARMYFDKSNFLMRMGATGFDTIGLTEEAGRDLLVS